MRIWIDTEFNEYKGDLISIALVDDDGIAFYEVVPCATPKSWVAANVIPKLYRAPIPFDTMQSRLETWLLRYDSIHIIADWPEDIEHFCAALITGPGERLNTPPLTMEVRRDLDASISTRPHNALADAEANRVLHLAMEALQTGNGK